MGIGSFDERVTNRRPSSLDTWVLPLLLVLTAASQLPIWTTPIPPLQDLPNHLLKVDIIWKYLKHDPQVRAVYALNLKLLSNYTFYVVVFLLSPLIGLVPAAKFFISVYLVALPLCTYAWLRRVNPTNILLALAVPAISYSLFLSKGNLNFCLALAVYIGALAVFEAPENRKGSALTFGLIATFLYFTHGLLFLTLTMVVGYLVIVSGRPEFWRRAIGLAPGLLCFAATVVPDLIAPRGSDAFAPSFEYSLDWHLIPDTLLWLFGVHGPGLDGWLAVGWVLVVAGCSFMTLLNVAKEARRSGPVAARLGQNRMMVPALALGLLYIFAPAKLTDWSQIRVRFIPIACLTLLGGLRLPASRFLRMAAACVFVGAALAIQLRSGEDFLRESKEVEEYISGIDTIEPGASLLPIYAESDVTLRVNLHSWAYYEMAKGGWSPYLQAYPSYHPVVYREKPWAPAEDLGREAFSGEVLRRATACYDYLLIWGADATDAARANASFDPVYRTQNLGIWRNRAGVRKSVPAAVPACRVALHGRVG